MEQFLKHNGVVFKFLPLIINGVQVLKSEGEPATEKDFNEQELRIKASKDQSEKEREAKALADAEAAQDLADEKEALAEIIKEQFAKPLAERMAAQKAKRKAERQDERKAKRDAARVK